MLVQWCRHLFHHHVVQEGLIKVAALLQVASCLVNSHMGHLCSHSSKQLQAVLELDSHPWGPMVCLAMGDLGRHLQPPAWSVSSSLCQHSSHITNRQCNTSHLHSSTQP
uniref:Uncharacterized protein n=1 Tax=Rhipicephalus appendiculatus TaxID=34631 RepID=A0A131YF01_RHIAP